MRRLAVSLRAGLAAAALCIALNATSAMAQIMPPVEDPVANSRALLDRLQSDGAEPFVAEVMRLLKKKGENTELSTNLRPFSKKKPDVLGLAYDRNYNDLIRVMVFYAQYDDNRYPFMYYQFTYKKIKEGWAMTNFRFENEASRTFPEGYAAP
ncbi:hypothetical protein [Bosea minatitlanensis]|uniref:DUF4864 domain-containing protein n=1 Tax=Bosea minatitlanensis TaxID=128782 RepID=A0ABW0F9J0_9HYPH|nr:hypothetical protein [Bosea minatitlanensis]MCT4495777.1 hypothetical protein [Bosea minatitlanensis]